MRLPVLAVLTALLAAGCVTPPPAEGPASSESFLAPPRVDAKETLAALKAFSEAYPYRQSGGSTHLGARDALEKAFEDAGLDTMRQSFPMSVRGLPVGAYDGENILGIKWGMDRTRWIVVGAHYDITEGAVYGAYDDGAGTVMVTKLAEAFAALPTDRTIAFIQFDAEERGLVGSSYFVRSVIEGTFEVPDVTVDGMIDLDMVGITWPHPAHLVCWENSPSLEAKSRELALAVGVPESNLEFREPRFGTSDGASFIAADIATAYFWSNWDAVKTKDGQELPAPYPFWHQADTYETMVRMAGDEPTLEAGFQTVLDIVSPLLLHMASSDWVPDPEPAE